MRVATRQLYSFAVELLYAPMCKALQINQFLRWWLYQSDGPHKVEIPVECKLELEFFFFNSFDRLLFFFVV